LNGIGGEEQGNLAMSERDVVTVLATAEQVIAVMAVGTVVAEGLYMMAVAHERNFSQIASKSAEVDPY
jgi:hypothetical protein